MKCYKPILIHTKNKLTGQEYDLIVPCRHCLACREERAKEYTIRFLHEIKNKYKNVYMLTLTYKNEDIIEKYQVEKQHITNYIKRVREQLRRYDKKHKTKYNDFKYFLGAEYGDKTQRPHYHMIIATNYKETRDKFIKDWELHFGEVDIKDADIRGIYYTIGYCNKKIGNNQDKYIGKRANTFRKFSKGLGKEYAYKNENLLRENKYIIFKNYKMPIPYYYKKILDLGSEAEYFNEVMKKRQIENEKTIKYYKDLYGKEKELGEEIIGKKKYIKYGKNTKGETIKYELEGIETVNDKIREMLKQRERNYITKYKNKEGKDKL